MTIEKPFEDGKCEKCIFVTGEDKDFCSVYYLGMSKMYCPHKRDCEKYKERKETRKG